MYCSRGRSTYGKLKCRPNSSQFLLFHSHLIHFADFAASGVCCFVLFLFLLLFFLFFLFFFFLFLFFFLFFFFFLNASFKGGSALFCYISLSRFFSSSSSFGWSKNGNKVMGKQMEEEDIKGEEKYNNVVVGYVKQGMWNDAVRDLLQALEHKMSFKEI